MKCTILDKSIYRAFLLVSVITFIFLIVACSPKSLHVKSELDSHEETKLSIIQDIQVSEEAETTKLTVQGTHAMSYTVFRPDNNAKIVLDIHDADLEKRVGDMEVNNGTINRVKTTKYDNESGKVARIEIGLDRTVDYRVVKDGTKLLVYVDKSVRAEATSVDDTGTVEDIHFRRIMGKSQVVVSTSRKAQYDLTRVSGDRLVLELMNMKVMKNLEDGLELKETDSAVKRVKPYETLVSGKKAVKIDIDLRAMVPYRIFQENSRLYVEFEKLPDHVSKEAYSRSAPLSRGEKQKIETATRTERTRELERKVDIEEETKPKELYSGKKISMDFKDADIKNLFRLIAEVSNLNIVAGEDVRGKVTVRMVDVPWDQALDVILATNNLGMIKVRNVISIAPADKIRQQEEAAIASKVRQEQVEELFTEIISVNYATAKDILPQVEAKLSKRGSVSADDRTNTVLITDTKDIVRKARGIIEQLDSPIPQVLIEARIVQTNPSFTSEIGIAWGGSYTNTAGAGDYTISGAAGGANYAINLPSSAIHGGIGYGFISDRYTLDLQLTAMEKDEKVKIISRPKIVTVDNKQAKIEQGVSLPYLKQTEDGISTEFKNATLTLEVTPHITPDGSIIMKVLAKKDQKSAQTGFGGEPGIDTRSAETEVLVKDGETTVIGGIYERTQTYSESGVPFLSKIPILGWLFKNKLQKDEITELLIFLTPTIIKQKPIT